MTPARSRRAGLPVIRRDKIAIEQLRRQRAAEGAHMENGELSKSGVRVVDLPEARMATSEGHRLDVFDTWWSAIDKQRTDRFFPRDFMYFDLDSSQLIWLYALPDTVKDTGQFK